MTLTFSNNRWEWRGGYDTRAVPKSAGFRWHPGDKVWATADPRVAGRLKDHADEAAKARLNSASSGAKEAAEASRAKTADLDIPRPDGLEYLPYQRAGVAYASSRAGTLIADEMGLGKTIQAIGAMRLHGDDAKCVVVCPASMAETWRREIRKWWPETSCAAANGELPHVDRGVLIVPDSRVAKHSEAIHEQAWDVAVLDESHRFKNRKAQRTKAALGIKAKRRLALTGTPILNKPIEVQAVLGVVVPLRVGGFLGIRETVLRRAAGRLRLEHGRRAALGRASGAPSRNRHGPPAQG